MSTSNHISSSDICAPARKARPPALAQTVTETAATADRDVLFAEFEPLVRKLTYQYAKDPDLRQDMLGEIYFRFCALLDAFDPSRGVPLRAYLVRQLSASVYTYARQGWRQQQRELHTEDMGASFAEAGENPTDGWDDALVMKDISEALPALLSKLPPRQAKVIVWRYYHDMSFEDIAERLEVKAATARSLLRHGLTQLRRHFGEVDLLTK